MCFKLLGLFVQHDKYRIYFTIRMFTNNVYFKATGVDQSSITELV